MFDPWAAPTPGQIAWLRAARAVVPAVVPAPWQQPPRMSLRSVPDARTTVPLLWWVPVVAVLMLGTTTVAILPGVGSGRIVLLATAVSVVGYLAVWARLRPARLFVGPHSWPSIEGSALDRIDPPTIALPAVGGQRSTARSRWLLLAAAAVGLGSSLAWSVLANVVLRPAAPAVHRTSTAGAAVVLALIDAVVTSVLEECGMAVLLLAVAGLAQRFLPVRWDTRSVAVTAIVASAVVRTVLHVPLWGVGAIGRLGLSFALAWLFWRTRRIWPLIAVHVAWDTLALQAAITPSLTARAWCALAVLGWGLTGVVLTVIAISRSKRDLGRAAQYYRRSRPFRTSSR